MRRAPLALAAALLAAACGGPKRPALPTGNSVPFPGYAAAYEQAVQECSDVKTITAELGLSGRAGSQKLRGRINAGLTAPSSVRLEGVAPFGPPVFILVARGARATLLLPRDDRVVRDAPPEAIVEALAGVALTPAELRAAISGCGLGSITPSAGRSFNDNSAALDSNAGTVYLRRVDGRWRIAGVVRDMLTLQYGDFEQGRASTVFVRTAVADLALKLSQVEINVPLEDRAFDVAIPKDALPLSVEELRRAGPLGSDRGQTRVRPQE